MQGLTVSVLDGESMDKITIARRSTPQNVRLVDYIYRALFAIVRITSHGNIFDTHSSCRI